jgi:hypothetical protein
MGHWCKGNYMNILKPVRLTDLKKQASFLLKDLCANSLKSQEAAAQFLKIPVFSGRPIRWILENKDSFKLKDALLVIALQNGFKGWPDLKKNVTQQDCLYRSAHVGLIYAWFSDYEKAVIYHSQNGGFLIKFWKDFAVCGNEYISCLSLSEYPDHWKKIGYNWVKPSDQQAWEFLNQKAIAHYLDQK